MEAELLHAFRRGDAVALERVYREHVARVEALVRRALYRANRFSGAHLADLVQEVFLKAFSPPAIAGYDGDRDYAPYVLAIARNVVIDWLRQAGREFSAPGAVEAFLEGLTIDPSEDQLFAPELVRAAAEYVSALPEELRGVHERRFIAAEPQQAAARALGITRQNLRTLESKLLRGLRRELARLAWEGIDLPQPKRRPNA